MDENKNELEHFEIRAELRGIIAEMEARDDLMHEKLDRILEQTTRTNGRVTSVENDIDFIRVLKKYKWMFGLLILGVYLLVQLVDLKKVVNMVL
jgi:hypothetical protein